MDSLPSEESTQELQAAGLASLEQVGLVLGLVVVTVTTQESEQAGAALAETVKQGERLLGSIQVPGFLRGHQNTLVPPQAALHEIASKQLEMERLTAEECIVAQQSSSATL